jgi:hypothetical protein
MSNPNELLDQLPDQSIAIFEAINAVGGQSALANLMDKNQSTIAYWLTKKIKPGQKLVKELDDAYLMEKVTGLRGLAVRIYPPLKKFEYYRYQTV